MLSVYTLEDSEKWDTIVRSFHEHDIYWLSGYEDVRNPVLKDSYGPYLCDPEDTMLV